MSGKDMNELLKKYAKEAVKNTNLKSYKDKKIAIDALSVILEFKRPPNLKNLKDKNGNVTSHLQGIFSRTIGFLKEGIEPIYVFDGNLPVKRKGSRKNYQLEPNYKSECDDAKKLLDLMGVSYVEAEEEAGALLSEMVRSKEVYGAATDIMNAFPFGTEILLRNFKVENRIKEEIEEIKLIDFITALKLNQDNFIDLCVLLGFNCDKIPGMGYETAYKKIKEHESGDQVFLNDEKYKNKKPENYDAALNSLKNPNLKTKNKAARVPPKVKELEDFLCKERNFDEKKIAKSLDVLKNLKVGSQKRSLSDEASTIKKAKTN